MSVSPGPEVLREALRLLGARPPHGVVGGEGLHHADVAAQRHRPPHPETLVPGGRDTETQRLDQSELRAQLGPDDKSAAVLCDAPEPNS